MKYKLILFLLFVVQICFSQVLPELVFVKGGTFTMGDNHYVGFEEEQPCHLVSVDDFWMGKTEITVLQWKTYCEENKIEMPSAPSWGWQDTHPMVNILWEEAVEYCNWLSKKTGKLYKLPTEAQWEYAAKGGQNGKSYKYSGGQWLDSVGWFATNSNRTTQPVAQKRANELGIYDMTGNVLEWCEDWEGRKYTKEHQYNPKGKEAGDFKICKGGAYAYAASINRTSYRLTLPPSVRRLQVGFRVIQLI